MPKVKTSRAAAKRFKTTGTGKLVRNKAYKSHILTKKSQKRKRNLRKSTVVDATNIKNMKKILPYTDLCADNYMYGRIFFMFLMFVASTTVDFLRFLFLF